MLVVGIEYFELYSTVSTCGAHSRLHACFHYNSSTIVRKLDKNKST